MTYAARGLGDAPDVFSNLEADFESIPNPFSTGADASNSISVTLPTSASSTQTFADWVNTNSTLLLVLFGAIGALVALTRVGK